MTKPEKYQRCMVFAGGGARFGIYLGMFAAASDAGRRPDLLLATCGGAMAAAIIQALPDDGTRLAWLCSRQMHEFWQQVRPSPNARLSNVLRRAAARRFARANAPVIPNLFDDFMFKLPSAIPLPAKSSTTHDATTDRVAVATIGGRLLFGPNDVGQVRGERKLYEETVFCEPRAAALLARMESPFRGPEWGQHAVSPMVNTNTLMPMALAAKVSVTDFYYFPATYVGADSYIGGVVDLFPIEVAHRLAHEVMMEYKQSFDQSLAIPAWRAALGLDGNQRLRQVNGQAADVWIDTTDVSRALAREQVHMRLNWWRNRITLRLPENLADYARYMEMQWQYGYQRATEALQRTSPADKSIMRRVNRFNRAMPYPT